MTEFIVMSQNTFRVVLYVVMLCDAALKKMLAWQWNSREMS